MNKKLLVGIVVFLLLLGGAVFVANPDILGGKLRRIGTKKTVTVEDKGKKKKGAAEEKKAEVKPVAAPAPIPTPISAIVKEATPPAVTLPVPATPPIPDIESVARQYFEQSAAYQKQSLDLEKQSFDLLTQILAAVKNPAIVPIYTPQTPSPQPPAPSPAPASTPTPEPPSPPSPKSPEPIAYWNFDEGSETTVSDSSGNENTGTIQGGATWVVGVKGKALSFDGVNDYINLGGSGPSLSEIAGDKLTIEAWIKPNVLTGTQQIMVKNGPFMFRLNGNKLGDPNYAIITDVGSWKGIRGNIPLTIGDWHHVAMTYDGSNIQLYVNGVSDASTPKTGNFGGDGCVQIGRYNDGGCDGGVGSYFNGLIDEVKIYDKALTEEQVKKMYDEAQKIANPPGLIAYYSFDDEENMGRDSSGNKYDGTPTGEPITITGKKEKAVLFNHNNNDSIQLTLPEKITVPGSAVTVALWMFWTGGSSQMPFGFNSYDLHFAGGAFGFNTARGDVLGIKSEGLSNRWVHVVAEFNNQNPAINKLYIDGVIQSLENLGDPINANQSITTRAFLSGWGTTNGEKFSGMLDEVKIYNRALTPEEVKAEYEG